MRRAGSCAEPAGSPAATLCTVISCSRAVAVSAAGATAKGRRIWQSAPPAALLRAATRKPQQQMNQSPRAELDTLGRWHRQQRSSPGSGERHLTAAAQPHGQQRGAAGAAGRGLQSTTWQPQPRPTGGGGGLQVRRPRGAPAAAPVLAPVLAPPRRCRRRLTPAAPHAAGVCASSSAPRAPAASAACSRSATAPSAPACCHYRTRSNAQARSLEPTA